ncbi:hypothetical protein BC497_29590 (plasmid) [Klebsiella variicola]|uniref:ATPase, T2SS/T4P/T4SS family n=1 Tax=Klebsiella variicola TaxID=244366 RepID=UPI000E35CE33|nr:ATPase, T2SS/T4P/T4SS family [Klebsiella variicola]AXO74130.1 hypothetical protein BC497_29590 [Klebsiella variicola]
MRMKPDHIFLAELRGEEVVAYLEALNTGHPGSITTVHANGAYDAFHRIAELVIANSISGAFTYDAPTHGQKNDRYSGLWKAPICKKSILIRQKN